MSIIRDIIEYYRLPAEIKTRLTDFDVNNTILDGYEEKFYYALDGSNHYTMLVDMFTNDDIRYHRKLFTYDSNFNILSIIHEYEYGKKSRLDSFVYGTGVTSGAVIRMNTTEADTNITWGTPDPSTGWPYYDFGGRVMGVVAGDNITVDNTDPRNPIVSSTGDFVTRTEFYETLSAYGLAKIDWFTYVNGTYTPRVVVSNDSVQLYTVPNLVEDTIIKCHLWGASSGGYTYGEFILKSPANFVESNPTHLYPGQLLCIHVGYLSSGYMSGDYIGRAAIWRYGTSYFNNYVNELLVAGGGGGGGAVGNTGGSSGWPGIPGGTGGTQSAGGVDPGSAAGNGQRVWGGIYGWNTCDGYKQSVAGDGLFGGGAGYGGEYYDPDCRHYASGGGGGSGYVRPGIQNAFTEAYTGPYPPHTSEIAWGLNAGVNGNPGRVAFEMRLG